MTALRILALLALLLVPQMGLAQDTGETSLEAALIESADTPAGHQALAQHYRDAAERAKSKSRMHEVMAQRYAGKTTARGRMAEHCRSLADSYEKQAADYTALAAGEEAAANRAPTQ
jgi:hypothetical protein